MPHGVRLPELVAEDWCGGFAAELVEVVNAQSGKGLAIKAGFLRENNGPGTDRTPGSLPLLDVHIRVDTLWKRYCALPYVQLSRVDN